MVKHKEYYKGEGDEFSQVQAVVSLMSLCLVNGCLCTKNVPIMHKSTCCLVCEGLCE